MTSSGQREHPACAASLGTQTPTERSTHNRGRRSAADRRPCVDSTRGAEATTNGRQRPRHKKPKTSRILAESKPTTQCGTETIHRSPGVLCTPLTTRKLAGDCGGKRETWQRNWTTHEVHGPAFFRWEDDALLPARGANVSGPWEKTARWQAPTTEQAEKTHAAHCQDPLRGPPPLGLTLSTCAASPPAKYPHSGERSEEKTHVNAKTSNT